MSPRGFDQLDLVHGSSSPSKAPASRARSPPFHSRLRDISFWGSASSPPVCLRSARGTRIVVEPFSIGGPIGSSLRVLRRTPSASSWRSSDEGRRARRDRLSRCRICLRRPRLGNATLDLPLRSHEPACSSSFLTDRGSRVAPVAPDGCGKFKFRVCREDDFHGRAGSLLTLGTTTARRSKSLRFPTRGDDGDADDDPGAARRGRPSSQS